MHMTSECRGLVLGMLVKLSGRAVSLMLPSSPPNPFSWDFSGRFLWFGTSGGGEGRGEEGREEGREEEGGGQGGDTSPFFPGIRIVSGSHQTPGLETDPVFEKNDGCKEWTRNQPLECWVLDCFQVSPPSQSL